MLTVSTSLETVISQLAVNSFYMRNCVVFGRYSPNELRYLPLNTALFEPPLDPELPALDSEPDSDDADDGKDDKKSKNSSVRVCSVHSTEIMCNLCY